MRMLCFRAAVPCMQSPPQRLGQTLGFRHAAWHRVRHAVCEERDGARAMGAGCEGAGRAADVVAAAPHLRGAARRGVAAPGRTREAMKRGQHGE